MALGRELVIKRSDGADGFDPVCITEQRSIQINNEEIDITKPDCLAPGSKLKKASMYGIQSIVVSGQGAFVSSVTMKTVVADAINQVVETYQVVVPGLGTFEGDAIFTNSNLNGDKSSELQIDITFSMNNAVFEAAA
ncbi:phage tail tube protein [Mycoplana rhizolycopersici]|uniref:Phage tail protein n=1 Tax=Mycoplana rhizolycopersici TaxID=2746702 RepID=A0ABX2Q9Q7_9HYPH|nr:phage tail tube protein [Rhizobium rhizolycopersici]NVP54459.1 phage tail protein [Rhizobium rhizolycopersici]